MWIRVVLISFCFIAGAIAAEPITNTRPSSCREGTTYKKDCNTCTCGATVAKDKCSTIDCKRGAGTTPAPTNARPGDCPTIVTPAPGSDICKNRAEKSSCTTDKDCSQAKKCCHNGCNVMSCRNAIYRYTK